MENVSTTGTVPRTATWIVVVVVAGDVFGGSRKGGRWFQRGRGDPIPRYFAANNIILGPNLAANWRMQYMYVEQWYVYYSSNYKPSKLL